jgi:hypothetical protein
MSMTLRVLTALTLFLDAGVHIHLAPGYQAATPGGIGQGNLFLLEGAAAVLSALYVLIRAAEPPTPSGRGFQRLRRRGVVPVRRHSGVRTVPGNV